MLCGRGEIVCRRGDAVPAPVGVITSSALKASEVVEARAMVRIYTHIGICQGKFFGTGM